jgi:leucyl aminopeptidase
MLAQLTSASAVPKSPDASHLLVLLPKDKAIPTAVPRRDLLVTVLKRRGIRPDELASGPVSGNAADGSLVVWAMLDFDNGIFAVQTAARKALQVLLDDKAPSVAIVVLGKEAERCSAAEAAVYAAWVNGTPLPTHKKTDQLKPLERIFLYGYADSRKFAALRALAEGNVLCRTFTVLPPNELTPGVYRKRIKALARTHGWKHEEFDLKALRKMGAGAFIAVAQGSPDEDAAIVHLSYRQTNAKRTVALVGKGICFDTGGHNLKPARHMHGMHEDMNGSAVALGILLSSTLEKLPVNIDCWLALAQNHISPTAYKQNDIIKALNGTTIEVTHTDAEGRMVLADTLTLASRRKPDLLIDFATLTGSMAVALGSRYSGVMGNRDSLLQTAIRAGQDCGERLCAFPMDDDYAPALDSKVADTKQCTLDGDADHILAACFLKRFVEQGVPWLHVDLSSSRCEGGLGGVASDVTGFGVGWGLQMLRA